MNKYPRTLHIEGSRAQRGDKPDRTVPFSDLRGRHLVVEEKLDGANTGISFDPDGSLQLQSRGHYLTGGPREVQFTLLKSWAPVVAGQLRPVLQDRYVLYGEWLYALHSMFYDALPHYFHEFDVWDRETDTFLSTPARREMLEGIPLLSVPVLHEGPVRSLDELRAMIGPSLYRTEAWRAARDEAARERGLDPEALAQVVDNDDLAEGLYVKWEEDGIVRGRYKYVRQSFTQTIIESGLHWNERPIVANRLAPGASIF